MRFLALVLLFALVEASEDNEQCTAPTTCSKEGSVVEDLEEGVELGILEVEERCEKIEVDCKDFDNVKYRPRDWKIQLGLPEFNELETCPDKSLRSLLAHISCVFPTENTLKFPMYWTERSLCDQLEYFVSQGTPGPTTVFLLIRPEHQQKCDLVQQLVKYNIGEKNVLVLNLGEDQEKMSETISTIDFGMYKTETLRLADIRRALEELDGSHRPLNWIDWIRQNFSLSTILTVYLSTVFIIISIIIRYVKTFRQLNDMQEAEEEDEEVEDPKNEGGVEEITETTSSSDGEYEKEEENEEEEEDNDEKDEEDEEETEDSSDESLESDQNEESTEQTEGTVEFNEWCKDNVQRKLLPEDQRAPDLDDIESYFNDYIVQARAPPNWGEDSDEDH